MKISTVIMLFVLCVCIIIAGIYLIGNDKCEDVQTMMDECTEITYTDTNIEIFEYDANTIEADITEADVIEHTDNIEADITETDIIEHTDNIEADITESTCIEPDTVEVDITELNIIEYTDESKLEIELELEEEDKWWTEDDLHMLAAVIYYEAGSDECTDRHQQLVGQVVVNRMYSTEFPNTIYDVIAQPMQYSSYNMVINNMGTDVIPQRCYDNALAVLNNDVDCPSDIVWQSGFIQGEIYEVHYTTYSTTYFCHR